MRGGFVEVRFVDDNGNRGDRGFFCRHQEAVKHPKVRRWLRDGKYEHCLVGVGDDDLFALAGGARVVGWFHAGENTFTRRNRLDYACAIFQNVNRHMVPDDAQFRLFADLLEGSSKLASDQPFVCLYSVKAALSLNDQSARFLSCQCQILPAVLLMVGKAVMWLTT